MHTTRPYLVGAALAFLLVSVFSFTQSNTKPENGGDKKTHRIVFQLITPDTSAY